MCTSSLSPPPGSGWCAPLLTPLLQGAAGEEGWHQAKLTQREVTPGEGLWHCTANELFAGLEKWEGGKGRGLVGREQRGKCHAARKRLDRLVLERCDWWAPQQNPYWLHRLQEITLFFFFGKRKKKDGRGKILFLSSSSEQRLQYTLMKEKALHHSVLHWLTVDTEWKWAAWEEPFSISEPQGVSPCAIFVREERGGVVRGELSCISSKLQGPQLASTTSITMGFKPGNSSGILFLMISSTWGCLWEKWHLCCVSKYQRVSAVLQKSF